MARAVRAAETVVAKAKAKARARADGPLSGATLCHGSAGALGVYRVTVP